LAGPTPTHSAHPGESDAGLARRRVVEELFDHGVDVGRHLQGNGPQLVLHQNTNTERIGK